MILFSKKIRTKGKYKVLIEWSYDSTTYALKDVNELLSKGIWVYVKNFNDYLKIL